jgi:hypothetical protein
LLEEDKVCVGESDDGVDAAFEQPRRYHEKTKLVQDENTELARVAWEKKLKKSRWLPEDKVNAAADAMAHLRNVILMVMLEEQLTKLQTQVDYAVSEGPTQIWSTLDEEDEELKKAAEKILTHEEKLAVELTNQEKMKHLLTDMHFRRSLLQERWQEVAATVHLEEYKIALRDGGFRETSENGEAEEEHVPVFGKEMMTEAILEHRLKNWLVEFVELHELICLGWCILLDKMFSSRNTMV